MLRPLLPEILLIVLAIVVLAFDLIWRPSRRRNLGWLTAGGFGITLLATLLWVVPPSTPELIFGGLIRNDFLAFVFRLLFMLAGLIVAILSMDTPDLGDKGEYYTLLIVSVFGMNLMAMASDIILLYLAVETASLTLYLLAGFLRENKSAEAGFKYFLFGAAASGIMLYGFSLLYGFTGQTNLYLIGALLLQGQTPIFPLAVVAILVLVGLGFKVAAVPFHFWAPDVYEGAPTPITAFISVASKAAGFAILARVMLVVFPAVQGYWVSLLMSMAIITMTLGNLLAVVQKNIKRLLAYSSIAQAGYALIGLVVVSPSGLAATIFYLAMYTFTNLATFGVIILVARVTGSEEIDSLAGLSRRSPGLALALLAGFLSLAGIPPLAGFMGKFFVFAAAMQQGLWPLAVIGVLNSIVGLYYYLNVIKVAYLNRSEQEHEPLPAPRGAAAAIIVCLAGVVALGVWAGPWLDWATQAAKNLF
jgi:NADH-quinone oxidoreductase subunit N